MTGIFISKWSVFPPTDEWFSSLKHKGKLWANRILNSKGSILKYERCFMVKTLNNSVINELLLHSGYLPLIAGKYWGCGVYSLYNRGLPLTHMVNGDFFSGSFKIGKVEVTNGEILDFEKRLSLIRGRGINNSFSFGSCQPDNKHFLKFRVSNNDLMCEGLRLLGDTTNILRIKSANPVNAVGLEGCVKGDLLLSLLLPERHYLSKLQLRVIDLFNANPKKLGERL